MDYASRQNKLCLALTGKGLDGLLVTHLPNIRYLCGFTGSAGVLAVLCSGRRPRLVFFTDGRYTEQAAQEVQHARVVIPSRPAAATAAQWLARQKAGKVAVEGDHISVEAFAALKRAAKAMRLRPQSGLVESLRMVKDAEELRRIRAAVEMGSELFPYVAGLVRPGAAETEIAALLEFEARRLGAEAMSFETIVAGGARSALPHGRASRQPLPPQGLVILDFGVILGGYCSDMTRTVHVGRASAKARSIYQAVLDSQLAGIAAVRPGVTTGSVDRAARRVLEKAGLGKYFTHSTGHGVGLEIHEPPRVGKKQPHVLQPGMVITIEPGAYLAGMGGVRIEDMVVVTGSGCEVLTPTGKEFLTLS